MTLLSRQTSAIRIAVSGLGKMGNYHAQAVQQLGAGVVEPYYKAGLDAQVRKARLVAVCDAEPARAAAWPGIPFFTDHAQLLATARPDICVIATPSATHFALATATLAAGVHAFVEKPLATRRADWEALDALARQHTVRLMAGHVERYNPVAITLRAMLHRGELRPSGYRFRRCQSHDPRIPDDIVTDKLIHDLDLALFFFGPIAECALLSTVRADGVVQEMTVRLRHASGLTGELFLSWLRPELGVLRECRLQTASGEVVGDFRAKGLSVAGRPVACAVPGWIKPDNNQIKDELADFIGYCLVPDPALPVIQPLLSPEEIAAATGFIEQCSKSGS